MKLIITETDPGLLAAEYLKALIRKRGPNPFTIAFPTGSTPARMYKHLIALYKAGELSFKNVISFNLDEYTGLDAARPESYHSYMRRNLFGHVDMQPQNINIPDGNAKDINVFCGQYEAKIKFCGGIDLFLGGVGTNGHIAFNEPGSPFDSRTRQVFLTEETIKDNARFFGGDIKAVPKSAITMGLGTILEAREIIILAAGQNKAAAIRQAVEGRQNTAWPITALQSHKNIYIVADKAAAGEISRGALKEHEVCCLGGL